MLDWFRGVWDDAASQDAYTWVERELGADVYGLHTIFEAGLPAPRTHGELRRSLKEHLYVDRTLLEDFVPADGRDPGRTIIRCDDHLAQMAIHMDGWSGYRQWFLFDDVWAAAHPEMAASLMRFGSHWDPRCRRRHARLTHCG